MTKEKAYKFLMDISYAFGNTSIEYLNEKDGEKMREAIEVLKQEPCDDACCQEENKSESDAISFKVDGDVVVKYEYTFGPRDGATKYKAKTVMTKEIFQECYEKWIKPQIRIVCDCCPQKKRDDLIRKQELIEYIDKAIEATNMNTTYEVGMRNGMRLIKSFITDEKPEYEEVKI